MKLSTKGRYAMVALTDLALANPGQLVTLSEISTKQSISLTYLEQLFVKLRKAGLVDSVRGPGGGYRLAKSPDAIRVSEILEAVDETVSALHRRNRGHVRHPRAVDEQSAMGKPERACLRVLAPNPSKRCCPQRSDTLPGRADLIYRGR